MWWNRLSEDNITLNKNTILIGKLGTRNKYTIFNAFLILAKWHIYKTKLNLSTISFHKFLCDLKYFLVVEKTIALRNDKLNRYQSTWQALEDQLT